MPHQALYQQKRVAPADAIRHVRKHAMDTIKKLETDHKITEDQRKTAEKSTQEVTDNYTKRVEEKLKKKEKEIMEV